MFNPVAVRAVTKLLPYYVGVNEPSVVELGNQRFSPGTAPHPQGVKTTEEFYRALGFSKYVAIDVNTKMSAIAMDLNFDLCDKYGYYTKYDLVTNNGTGEHIFNQYQVFKNIHNLCKLDGIMLHILPMTGWINHGFYNYNPFLFRDLAAANNYEILFVWLSKRDMEPIDVTNNPHLFQEKRPTELIRVIHKLNSANTYLVVAMKNRSDNLAEFRTPIQGKYRGDIDSSEIGDRYGEK